MLNISSSLTNELQDKAYRDAYVASQVQLRFLSSLGRSVREETGANPS